MVAQHVVTLANSIVGVSVLAMPFCFKQCGVVLATVILLLGAIMTRMVCHFLLKGAIITRRRTYELLAFHTFGHAGKFLVEITIIGFLVGTLIAFLVVMGDLGPQILVEIFTLENNSSLRTVVMTALALFIALPLGLLRNIDSLSNVSTASFFFYLFLVCKLFAESLEPLLTGSFVNRINYWRPAGILQCIPIFSMALSCQTQVLGMYDILPDPSVNKMNEVIKNAVYICTGFYICVGCLGYVAFCSEYFGGNILLNFSPSWSTQLIKMCFLLSIAFSFPIVILPCRASLHSLIFKGSHLHHNIQDITSTYIPESRIRVLTVAIIGVTLIMGLIIPNIELVLGLVGSTCGSIICIICPTMMFIQVTAKDTTERLLAKTVFFVGVCILVLTTYVTLYAVEQAQTEPIPAHDHARNGVTDILRLVQRVEDNMPSGQIDDVISPPKLPAFDELNLKGKTVGISEKAIKNVGQEDHNIAPALAQGVKPSPASSPPSIPKSKSTSERSPEAENAVAKGNGVKDFSKNEDPVFRRNVVHDGPPAQIETKDKLEISENEIKSKISQGLSKENQIDEPEVPGLDVKLPKQKDEGVIANVPEKPHPPAPAPPESPSKPDDIPAKPKPELAQKPAASAPTPAEKKEFVPEEFLKKLEEQNAEQKKLIEQQKEILAKFEEHHKEDLKREKAVEHSVSSKEAEKQPEAAMQVGEPPQPQPDNARQHVNASVDNVIQKDEPIQEKGNYPVSDLNLKHKISISDAKNGVSENEKHQQPHVGVPPVQIKQLDQLPAVNPDENMLADTIPVENNLPGANPEAVEMDELKDGQGDKNIIAKHSELPKNKTERNQNIKNVLAPLHGKPKQEVEPIISEVPPPLENIVVKSKPDREM